MHTYSGQLGTKIATTSPGRMERERAAFVTLWERTSAWEGGVRKGGGGVRKGGGGVKETDTAKEVSGMNGVPKI